MASSVSSGGGDARPFGFTLERDSPDGDGAPVLGVRGWHGIGLGIYLLGAVSKALTPIFAEEALRYSLYVGQWFYALAAILLIISARSLKKDWVD